MITIKHTRMNASMHTLTIKVGERWGINVTFYRRKRTPAPAPVLPRLPLKGLVYEAHHGEVTYRHPGLGG